jgi:hypothetical protein
MTTKCEYGSCARAPRAVVTIIDLKTKDARTVQVCREHAAAVLAACDGPANLHADMRLIERT